MKVLIIDDNIAIQEIIGEILTDEGHEVKKVGSYSTAMDVLEAFEPDALVLDSQIGDQDGIRLLDELDPESTIKAVVITKNRDIRVDSPFVTRVIQKPFKSSEIIAAMRSIEENNRGLPSKDKKFKFKLFGKTEQVDESALGEDPSVKFGKSYIVFEEVPSAVYRVASSLAGSCNLMIVTTGKIKVVSDRFEGSDVRVIGITVKPRLGYMDMSRMGTLMSTITEFVKEKPRPVVIFDDLEQLISINGQNQVLMMLHQIINTDTVTVAVSIDGDTLTDKDKELFLNYMQEYGRKEE